MCMRAYVAVWCAPYALCHHRREAKSATKGWPRPWLPNVLTVSLYVKKTLDFGLTQ